MRIKTFQGRTLEEILPQIKAELGPNAVVVGQRQKVQGGVAGFFGTKVIEVTAADQMPGDDLLVDLEDRIMGGETGTGTPEREPDEQESALADRFRSAMTMGRRGGLDVTDDWDPSEDAELAHEYGRVLEHAASAGFAELDVPVVASAANATAAPAPMPSPLLTEPIDQARALVDRTHDHLRASTARAEQAATGGTYAPPRALPRTDSAPPNMTTFAASVQDTPGGAFEPQAVPAGTSPATSVDHALRTDLALPRSSDDELAEALGAAIDILDLPDIAALRGVVHRTRRTHDTTELHDRARGVLERLDAELTPITSHLHAVGVDQDVIDSLVDTAVRHRMPFGGEQDPAVLLRTIVEETIEVRTGYPRLDRPYRMAFVGPANAGTTSLVAKVAGRYAATGMRVGILSISDAAPGVAIMAERCFQDLEVDVRYATNVGQVVDAVDAFESHDIMLVDTPSGTYLDAGIRAHVQSCLLAVGIDDLHIVMPLATSSREARSVVDTFRPLGANRLAVTRIDESRYVGELLNFCFRLGLPMTFLSDGARVPEDVHAANAREIADRIMGPTGSR